MDFKQHRSNIYNNYLMHWKYIKREKVNGKYRYIYKDDEFDAAKQQVQAVQNEYSMLKKKVEDAEKKVNDSWKKVEEARATGADYFDEKRHEAEINFDNAARENIKAHDELYDKERHLDKVSNDYHSAYAKYRRSVGHDIADSLTKAAEKHTSVKNVAVDTIVDTINDLPGADKVNELLKPLDEYFHLYQEVEDSKIKAGGKIPDAVSDLANRGRGFVDRLFKKKK